MQASSRLTAVLPAVLWCALALAAEPTAPTAPTTHAGRTTALAPAGATARATQPFAHVGNTVISGADYQRALAVAMRKKYYHAKPPEAEYAQFQRQVGDDVVNRTLLLAEARRRGVQPDQTRIQATVAGYDAQYKGSANWQGNRERMLAAVVPQLEAESLLERFERIVRQVPEPSEAEARRYYDSHSELFVEPEQVKLRVLVLRVDPSSPQSVWNSARNEARQIHKKLVAGADFAELARLHSGDKSASRGGEMDYTHRGMLPEAVHGVVDRLELGAVSEPVQLLEGVAILRLDGRRKAQQRSFDQVQQRAGDLWQRAEADQRWAKLIAALRQATPIRIDESHYAPLRGPSEKPQAG
ncbi:MAG: peptidyl-prolyl cis-trans isomerase [Rubrivivax sp.]|nr:peptidyl-prolyl cis-trans isomerase [Rubrivivax sp.]